MIDEIEQDVRADRRNVRRQIWAVLGVLFLVALAITAYQEYYATPLARQNPIDWKTMEWETAERELNRGRKMLIVILDETNDSANQDLLEKFETAEIREQVYRSRLLPLKLSAASDSEFFALLRERFLLETIPCGVLRAGKGKAIIFDQGMTSTEIAGKIEKARKARD